VRFDTERFVLRPFVEDDADDAFAMYGDPEVMRFLGSGDLPSHPDAGYTRKVLAASITRAADLPEGLGSWAMERKEDGRVVGAVGLSPMPDGEIEVFYHLARAYWGQGYATEAAAAMIVHGFEDLALDRIVAYAYAANPASRNVLRKLGMNHVGPREAFGNTLEYFVLPRN
jgi:[ribosomal protein S5]-alanine N-acetyltransferase